VATHIEAIAERYAIREVCYDPWRFRSEALRLEESGLPMVEFPQSMSRMVPASEKLYAAIIEGRLTHPDDPDLNAHVANAVAKQTPRGWRIDKSHPDDQIDAVVALAMAIDRAEQPVERTQLVGWL
ncbi:MAG: terminase TerL endonuclease subunit, partial [Solirubrobacterales bacterium]